MRSLFLILFVLVTVNVLSQAVDTIWTKERTQAFLLYKSINQKGVDSRSHAPDSARIYFREALNMALSWHFWNGAGTTYYNLGALASETGNQQLAIQLEDSSIYYHSIDSKSANFGMNYNVKGGAYTFMGNFEMAAEMYYKAIQETEAIKDSGNLPFVYYNLATTYLEMQRLHDALKYALKHYEIAGDLKNNIEKGYSCVVIMECYLEMSKTDSAYIYFKELKQYVDAVNDEYLSILYYKNSGMYFMKTGNNQEAISQLLKAADLNKNLIDRSVQCIIYNHLGEALIQEKQYDKAYQYLNQSLTLSQLAEANNKRLETLRLLKEVSEKQNNYKAAYEFGLAEKKLSDSLFNYQMNISVSNAEAKFQNEKKQSQLELLSRENDNNILKLKNQEWQRNLLMVILLFVIVIIGSAFYLNRQHNRIKLLQQQEHSRIALEETRTKIARDLHDDIGSNLSKISLLSEVADKYSESEESKYRMQHIASTARNTLGQMSEMVWAMNRKNDSLQNLVSYIRKYAAEYFEYTDINCKILLPEKIKDAEINGDYRRNVFLSVKETLHNIVKHADAKNVVLKFMVDVNLEIVITDDGKGFELNTHHTGNGITNIKSRMDAVNGLFHIENKAGTIVKLSIPLPVNS